MVKSQQGVSKQFQLPLSICQLALDRSLTMLYYCPPTSFPVCACMSACFCACAHLSERIKQMHHGGKLAPTSMRHIVKVLCLHANRYMHARVHVFKLTGHAREVFVKGKKKCKRSAAVHAVWADTVSHRSTVCVPISSIGVSLRGMARGFMEGQGAAARRLSAPITLLIPSVLSSFSHPASPRQFPGLPVSQMLPLPSALWPLTQTVCPPLYLPVCVCASP